MKAGIISDTHDNTKNVSRAIDIFNQNNVDYIFHSCDITLPFTVSAFSRVRGKFISVFGNCDIHKNELKNTIEYFGGQMDSFFSGQINGKKIFMAHMMRNPTQQAKSGKYDIIIYGHTHKTDIRRLENALIVNPGQAKDKKGCVAILDFDTLDCETVNLK